MNNEYFDSKEFFIDMFIQNKDKYDNVLYVHSPFCISNCNYCRFRGKAISEININSIENYYYIDFEKQINSFKKIFDNVNFSEIYFGGGTVNFSTSTKYFEKLVSLIPNFKNIKKKSIELHPQNFTDEYLTKIIEYNFNYVSIGIQSLKKETLKLENRYFCTFEKLNNIIKKLDKYDIFSNVDIIINLENETIDETFENCQKILELISPTSITIQPNKCYSYEGPEFMMFYYKIKELLDNNNKYCLINANLDMKDFINDYNFFNEFGIEYRIVKKEKKNFYNYLFTKKANNDFYNYNVLGIGYLNNINSNHACSFTNGIYYDDSVNVIFTLPDKERVETCNAQKILLDNIKCE